MTESVKSIDKKQLWFHLPKILLILGCLGYEIYIFISYSSLYRKYSYLTYDLIVYGILLIVLFVLSLRILKSYQQFKKQNNESRLKRVRYSLIYFAIMGIVIYIPTLVFSFSMSGPLFFLSLPLQMLLLIEFLFLLIVRSEKALNNWDQRIHKRKVIFVGVLLLSLLLPYISQIAVNQYTSLSNGSEISMEIQFDTEAYPTFPLQTQQQVLDNASDFILSSYDYNGTLADYVTDNIIEYDLTNKTYPGFISVMINGLSYVARITIFQTNLTLNCTAGSYSSVDVSSAEYNSLYWHHYPSCSSCPYWISPSLNFSLTVGSSVNLTGTIYFCEFDVRVQYRSMWGDRCDLRDRCILDSNGQILIITRLHDCVYYI